MSFRAVTAYSNFSRGRLDHDLSGRFELPIYQNGAKAFENFISNFKGNAIFRTGFENILAFQDCAFIEFRFTENQNYILVLYANKMRFLSYDVNGDFGWVLDSGGPAVLEVATPYTLAQSKEISFRKAYSQNFDTMIICHDQHEPYKLVRTAADDFEFHPFARKDDPFVVTNAATKNITAVTQAVNAQVTVVAHGYSVDDRVTIASITGMTQLNGWTARVVSVVGANDFTIDVDTTSFTAYAANGTTAEVTAGDYPSLTLFYRGRLYYAATEDDITTIFWSEAGEYYIHTIPGSITDDSAFTFALAELTSRIEWLFPGQNSLIVGSNNAIIAVNGGGVGEPITAETVDSIVTSADGANNVEPLAKDGFVFYISNDGRHTYYFSYDIITETFTAEDANILSYEITKGGITKFRHVKSREDLIFAIRSDGRLLTCNFFKKENIIGWHEHPTEGVVQDMAQISDNDGTEQLFVLSVRNSVYYIERLAPAAEFSQRKDFFSGDTSEDEEADHEAFYRKIAEELKDCIYLDNSETLSDLQSSTIVYDPNTGILTDASNPFVIGDIGKHIVYKTTTGYESGRFEIVDFNSAGSVDVDVLQEPTANTYASWYLTFSTVSGLSRFNGLSIGVVADGGFLSDFTVSGGVIDLEQQVTHVVVGYKYTGFINSFPLGFQVQGENTQVTVKNISRTGLRFVNTASGKFGAKRYGAQAVQQLHQDDLNYLPPLPMNTTEFVDYIDDSEINREFVVVQDEPLPMTLTSVMLEANYGMTK